MPTFEVIEALRHHCGQMVRIMRPEHREAIARVGMDAHRELVSVFGQSSFRRAWLIDGKLAALGGVTGSKASAIGCIWLALSSEALKYPVQIIKEARRQLDEIMLVKRELATTIIQGDEAAKRFAVFLGFHVDHDGDGQPAFSRLARRALAQHLDTTPDVRIPIGGGFAIAMGYHIEEAPQCALPQ